MIPIDHHALLSDQKSLALVDPLASVVWLCAPRPDAPPFFGALLDDDAGVFSIVPLDGRWLTQAYEGDTMVLRTRFEGIDVVDFFDRTCTEGSRLVRRIEGRGPVSIRFAPRPDLGRSRTKLVADGSAIEVEGTSFRLLASESIGFELSAEQGNQEMSAVVRVDGVLILELLCAASVSVETEEERRFATARVAAHWVKSLSFPPAPRRELLRRSALVLKHLVYAPTGAMVAAATTSLPEALGGERNWDYRYCWPRDAAFAAITLARLGDLETGTALLEFLAGRAEDLSQRGRLEPLYTVDGRALHGEETRPELHGYGGSRPVRIGNGAAGQVQLDVFGPVIDLIATLHESGATLDEEAVEFCRRLLDAVHQSWDHPGHGVWELRAQKRHHVYSRGMCWLALTRGADLLEAWSVVSTNIGAGGEARSEFEGEINRHRELAKTLQTQVAERGWSERKQSYTMAFDEEHLDAAVLKLIGSGFFTDAERERRTTSAIESELREGPTVFRYRMDDGLPGEEGGFHLCACWLVDALQSCGRNQDARDLFDQICNLAGPLQLLSEEHDPARGVQPTGRSRALGNFPQAYSHLAVLDSARKLFG